MMTAATVFFGVGLTALAYVTSRRLAVRYPSPLTTPVLFGTAVVMGILVMTGQSLGDYRPARDLITYMLGPATVALAVPVYRNRAFLAKYVAVALCGIIGGLLSTTICAVTLAVWFDLPNDVVHSIGMKSITAPVAVAISRILHGDSSLTAAFVIATGTMGAALGPWLMDRLGVDDPFARGLSLGTVSHGQGTAQAAIEGPLQGASASIAMALSALAASFTVPLLLKYWV